MYLVGWLVIKLVIFIISLVFSYNVVINIIVNDWVIKLYFYNLYNSLLSNLGNNFCSWIGELFIVVCEISWVGLGIGWCEVN